RTRRFGSATWARCRARCRWRPSDRGGCSPAPGCGESVTPPPTSTAGPGTTRPPTPTPPCSPLTTASCCTGRSPGPPWPRSTSSKVYEYMASALPVVSVHDPGNAASEVLRGYPLWFPAADLSAPAVADALEAAAHAARTADRATRDRAARYAAGFARDRQLRP